MAKILKKPKKPASKPTYKGALDALFGAMDKAPIAADHPIFKKENDKEYYETQLMFSYRKQQAARHHIGNVEAMLEKTKAAAMVVMAKHDEPGKKIASLTVSMISTGGASTACIHELSAFLAAIRSGLDFLAHAAARTIKGITAHSVHDLEKMAAKSSVAGPIIDVIKNHEDWLRELRGYRDEAVHNQVIQASAEGWLVSVKGKASMALIPIVVPRKSPKRGLDTRRSRMMDSEFLAGMGRTESYGTVTYSNGTTKVIEHKVEFIPPESHMPIVEMMEHHLSAYQKFSAEMFAAIVASKFGETK